MRVSLRLEAHKLGRGFFSPNLCPAQEETLLGCEAVNVRGARLALERFQIRIVRDIKSAEVGNRFARDELALQMQTRLSLKSAELIDDAISARVEILFITFRP